MKQIVALSNLTGPEEDRRLYDYLFAVSGKSRPRICFLTTAQGDNPDGLLFLYSVFSELECKPSHISLLFPEIADLRAAVFAADIIWVAGGNTKNLLALWRAWGLDAILQEAYEAGIVLGGWSAGAMCWFEQGLTDSLPGSLNSLDCLGLLPGSFCPHYDSAPERKARLVELIGEGTLKRGVAVEDGSILHYVDGKLAEVVNSRAGAKSFSVMSEHGEVIEAELVSRFLG